MNTTNKLTEKIVSFNKFKSSILLKKIIKQPTDIDVPKIALNILLFNIFISILLVPHFLYFD